MSLINQMLRDLDARHAPAVDRAALPSAAQVIRQERRGQPWLALGLALAVVAAASWYWLAGRTEPVPPPQAIQQPPAPPVAAVQAAVAPQVQADVAPQAQADAEPRPAPAAETSVPADRQAEESDAVPAPAVEPAATPAKVAVVVAAPARRKSSAAAGIVPMRLETSLRSVDEKVTVATAPTIVVPPRPAPAEQTSIDKHPRTSPANDAAENEYRKAMSALRRGSTTEAVEGLHAALRVDKRHVSARQALLSLLVEKQQWSEAQALIDEGLAVDPTQTGWAMILARLQLENGKLAEAGETLARHAAHAEQNADYQAFHALVLQRLKRPGEAAARYRAALAVRPAESRWWYGLGLSLESDQRPQEAREAFLKARETGNLAPELAAAVDQRLR